MISKSKQLKILEYFYMNSLLLHVKSNYSPTFKSKSKWAEQDDTGWSTYKGQQREIPKHRKSKKKKPQFLITSKKKTLENDFHSFSVVICCKTPPNTEKPRWEEI